jgi:hypothetical protein
VTPAELKEAIARTEQEIANAGRVAQQTGAVWSNAFVGGGPQHAVARCRGRHERWQPDEGPES